MTMKTIDFVNPLVHALYVTIECVIPYLIVSFEPTAVQNRGVNMSE